MKKLLEYQVENPVVASAKKEGWVVRKVSWVGRIGAMDRVFLKDGRVVFIEFKGTGKKPRETQEVEIEEFKKAGAEVFVVDNVQEGLDILEITKL